MVDKENKEIDMYILNAGEPIRHRKVQKNRVKTKKEIAFQKKLIAEMNKIAKNYEIKRNKRLCPTCLQMGINYTYSDSYDEAIDDTAIKTTCLECGTKTILDLKTFNPILINYSIADDEIYKFNHSNMMFDEDPIKALKGFDLIDAYKAFKKVIEKKRGK